MEILGYSMALPTSAGNPQDDIITKLVTADSMASRGLTDDEFGFFMVLLAVPATRHLKGRQ